MSQISSVDLFTKFKNYQYDHGQGFIFRMLFYSAVGFTIFLFTFIKPLKLYERLITWLFNKTFTIRGVSWKIYHALIFIIFIYALLLIFLILQADRYIAKPNELHPHKLNRLNQKWIIEAEIWLTTLICIELLSIYRLATIFENTNKLLN